MIQGVHRCVSKRRLGLIMLFVVATSVSCDKVPLLAPTQSTVTLQVNTTTLPINGAAELMATVTEQAGTPVHNGTTVTFTASFGIVEPREAITEGGVARATFRAGTQSGTARVGAFSGSARSEDVEILVGGAAAQSVSVRVQPSTVPQTGGTVTVSAVVSDAAGNRLPGVPVVFATDNGVLATNGGTTDANGEVRTTLTTNRESVVRASVADKEGTATVTVVNLPTVAVAVTTQNPIVGLPVAFTVTPGSTTGGNPVQSVTLDFGDGSPVRNLGAITGATVVTHVYQRADLYTATATITDTGGQRSTSSTVVAVFRAVVSVSVTASPAAGTVGTPISFTVTVANPSNLPIQGVALTFGDGSATTLGPTGGTALHTYITSGTFNVNAIATDQRGDTYRGTTQVLIAPAAALTVTLDAVSGDPAITLACPGTTYPKTCTTNFLGAGVRVIFTAGCGAGFGGAGVCANATGFFWNFGDGTTEATTSPSTDHIFRTRGEFVITAQVQTNTGATGAQRITIIIQ